MKTLYKTLFFGLLTTVACNVFAETTTNMNGDGIANQTTTTNAAMPANDTAITALIKTKLAADAGLKADRIKIMTKDGIVNLSGIVDSDTQASSIVEIAESTSGVKSVDTDNLKVKESQHPMDDAFITAKVKGTFVREKLFGETDVAPISIHVETKNGIVHLSGTADNATQIQNAVSLAKDIKGVKNVESTIKLQNEMSTQ